MARAKHIPSPDAADIRLVDECTEKETLTAQVNAELLNWMAESVPPEDRDAFVDGALLAAFRLRVKNANQRRNVLARWAKPRPAPKETAAVAVTAAAYAAWNALGSTARARQDALAAAVEADRKRRAADYPSATGADRRIRIPASVLDAVRAHARTVGATARDVLSGVLLRAKK